MIKNKRILLTGDDGYNSIGTRLLVNLLKDDNDVKIVATYTQQSAVGGIITLGKPELEFGRENVDGVEAIYVKGSPVDAIESAPEFFKQPFDLVISGVNLGDNVCYAVISSGTFAAAVRALGCKLAPKVVAMSLQAHVSKFFKNHNGEDLITEYLEYPGKEIIESLDLIYENDFWGKNIVNVNFPENKPETIIGLDSNENGKFKITKMDYNLQDYWMHNFEIDEEHKIIRRFNGSTYSPNRSRDNSLDTGALTNGFISINPITFE